MNADNKVDYYLKVMKIKINQNWEKKKKKKKKKHRNVRRLRKSSTTFQK